MNDLYTLYLRNLAICWHVVGSIDKRQVLLGPRHENRRHRPEVERFELSTCALISQQIAQTFTNLLGLYLGSIEADVGNKIANTRWNSYLVLDEIYEIYMHSSGEKNIPLHLSFLSKFWWLYHICQEETQTICNFRRDCWNLTNCIGISQIIQKCWEMPKIWTKIRNNWR